MNLKIIAAFFAVTGILAWHADAQNDQVVSNTAPNFEKVDAWNMAVVKTRLLAVNCDACAFSHDCNWLAYAIRMNPNECYVIIKKINDNSSVEQKVQIGDKPVQFLIWSPDDKRILCVSDWKMKVIETESGRIIDIPRNYPFNDEGFWEGNMIYYFSGTQAGTFDMDTLESSVEFNQSKAQEISNKLNDPKNGASENPNAYFEESAPNPMVNNYFKIGNQETSVLVTSREKSYSKCLVFSDIGGGCKFKWTSNLKYIAKISRPNALTGAPGELTLYTIGFSPDFPYKLHKPMLLIYNKAA